MGSSLLIKPPVNHLIRKAMGACLSCILGDSEEASSPNTFASPSSLQNFKSSTGSGHNKFINASSSAGGAKAKMKSDRIDSLIEKQASEQSNVVKILLLGKV